jgi:hypothetical protein
LFAYGSHQRRALWLRPPWRADAVLALALSAGSVGQLLLYAAYDWRAGWCYGPRYLLDILPALVWLLAPLTRAWRRPAWSLFLVALAFSIGIQIVGAFCYPRGDSDERHDSPAHDMFAAPASVWRWREFPPWLELRGGLANPDLLPGRWRVRPEWSG